MESMCGAGVLCTPTPPETFGWLNYMCEWPRSYNKPPRHAPDVRRTACHGAAHGTHVFFWMWKVCVGGACDPPRHAQHTRHARRVTVAREWL